MNCTTEFARAVDRYQLFLNAAVLIGSSSVWPATRNRRSLNSSSTFTTSPSAVWPSFDRSADADGNRIPDGSLSVIWPLRNTTCSLPVSTSERNLSCSALYAAIRFSDASFCRRSSASSFSVAAFSPLTLPSSASLLFVASSSAPSSPPRSLIFWPSVFSVSACFFCASASCSLSDLFSSRAFWYVDDFTQATSASANNKGVLLMGPNVPEE